MSRIIQKSEWNAQWDAQFWSNNPNKYPNYVYNPYIYDKEHDKKIREDAIDECIKTIIDYCGGLPNGMYVNALKQLKGE